MAVIEGEGVLADALRSAGPIVDNAATVVVASVDSRSIPFDHLTDEDFDLAWEQPMLAAIGAFQRAHRAGHSRVIAIVPTIGMSGAPTLAHASATAEAVRVLVKSAARQWGRDGITVNCIAVAPSLFGIDERIVGAVSIAPPALASAGDIVSDIVPLIRMLAANDAHHVTGATLTADGGLWMSP